MPVDISKMPIYKIIGADITTKKSTTYEVDCAGIIQKNSFGRPIIKPANLSHYAIYLHSDNTYAIELFDSVGKSASSSQPAFICRYGHMNVKKIEDGVAFIPSHLPVRELILDWNFVPGVYDFGKRIEVFENACLERIFIFDGCGPDERVPDGGVFINKDLFYSNPDF